MCIRDSLKIQRTSKYKNFAHRIHTWPYAYFIPHSKTDVYREGNKAIITRTGNVTCPVNIVLRYVCCKTDTNSPGLLIRQLIFRENSNSYGLGNKGISYSRCWESFLDALTSLGYDSKLFGLPSLRSCGPTGVSNSLGGTVSDRLLKNYMEDANPITTRTSIFKKTYQQEHQFSSSLGI